jgi:pimeloyl-ACP methyl ester carboxylesterase
VDTATNPNPILSGSEDLGTPLRLFSQKKQYARPNILMNEIPNAGHFPWIENPTDVAVAFTEFCVKLNEIQAK